MDPNAGNTARRSTRTALAAAAGLLALAVAAFAVRHALQTPARTEPTPAPETDPRVTFATPYRNVRPDVRYVGDEACARCHRKLAESYHQHPMGRSLAP